MYIKSRSLLPKPPREAEEEEDPEEALVRQLKEYKLFKQAGEKLNELSAGMRGVFSRLPEEFALPPQEYELEQATAEELFAAFMDVLNREEPESSIPEIAKKVDADKYTVRTQLVKIRARLKENTSVTFDELFEAASVKLEKIVTFMALLEMIARQEILLKQPTPYGRITITAYNLKEDDADAEYMDE